MLQLLGVIEISYPDTWSAIVEKKKVRLTELSKTCPKEEALETFEPLTERNVLEANQKSHEQGQSEHITQTSSITKGVSQGSMHSERKASHQLGIEVNHVHSGPM